MSRLDAEYDPTEHHDLDRIEPPPVGDPSPSYTAVCACGWFASWHSVRKAREEHDDHRAEALGIGCG